MKFRLGLANGVLLKSWDLVKLGQVRSIQVPILQPQCNNGVGLTRRPMFCSAQNGRN